MRPEETALICHSPLVFTRYRWAAAVHALPDHLPDDRYGFPGHPHGGQGGIRDIAHEYCNIVIDLFSPH